MLLERDGELSALRALAGRAAQGEPGLLLVEGPAGIGKTRLLLAGRTLAADAGVRVLAARGHELEQELAFGMVRQLFEAAVSESLLAGGAAAAGEVFEGPASGEDASFAILHALYRLTVNLADDAPLMLVVDDLQWCDEPSLRWLAYLVRRLDGLRVTVLAGVRPFERHAQAHLLGELSRDPLAVLLQPEALSERASAELVGGDEVFTRACHDATGGNPLWLVELARALRAEGVRPDAANVAAVDAIAPRAVSRAVLVRIGRLSRDAAAVARSTAVLGDEAALPLVAELAALDDGAAAAAASELIGAEVFADGVAMAFVHPLLRAAVYEDLPAHERALAHERAARLLDERGAAPGSVATHLLHAPARGEAWVVDVLERAAGVAQRAGSPHGSIACLTRALVEPPAPEHRVRVLMALASSEKLLHSEVGDDHLREVLELTDDPIVRAIAALLLAGGLLMSRRADEAVAIVRRATAELPPQAELLHAALESIELSAPLFGASEPVTLERIAHHLRLPLAPGLAPRLVAAVAAYQWALNGGSAADCAGLALAALADGEVVRGGHLVPSVAAGMVLEFADRDETDDVWAALRRHAHASGSMGFKSATSVCGGYMLYRHGELDAAEASLRDGIEELFLGYAEAEGRVEIASWLAGIQRERGDLAAARRELMAASDPGDTSQSARHWLDSLAEQLFAEEDFERSLDVACDAAGRFGHLSVLDTPARSHQALALHRLGRPDEAVALAAAEVEMARRWGAPSILARALRVLGTVERTEGLEHLREAVSLAERSPARLEHAKALVALGAALRVVGQPLAARDGLRQALDLAEGLGARAVSARARYELYAAGGRPRRTALRGPDALTPSERRVAEHAAAGQTNREIAEALFVTAKTVELHLRNTYRKLGTSNRRDLAAQLAGPSDDGRNTRVPV